MDAHIASNSITLNTDVQHDLRSSGNHVQCHNDSCEYHAQTDTPPFLVMLHSRGQHVDCIDNIFPSFSVVLVFKLHINALKQRSFYPLSRIRLN